MNYLVDGTETDKLMDLSDPELPHLLTNSVLRKAKQERQDINLLGKS